MIKSAYLKVLRTKRKLQLQYRTNEMKILQLQEKNSRILQDIYSLISSMDAVHRERRNSAEVDSE